MTNDVEIETPQPIESQPRFRDVQFDELLEDIFGLSGRSLRTIKALIFKPVEYFQAAKHPFWKNAYSPSFRIFLGLVAISTALKYFYASEDGALFKFFETFLTEALSEEIDDLSELGLDPSLFDVKDAVRRTLQSFFLLSTPLSIAFFLIVAALFRSFGEKLRFVVRARFIFAILIPLAALGLISAIGMIILPAGWVEITSNLNMVLSIILMAVTAYRGAFSSVPSKLGRLGRSVGLTALISFMYTLASAIALGEGMYKSGYEFGERVAIATQELESQKKEIQDALDAGSEAPMDIDATPAKPTENTEPQKNETPKPEQ
jgi:hypothetical protein